MFPLFGTWFKTHHCIEKILEVHNISLLNDDSSTHYTSPTNTTSVIDMGLYSSNIVPDFKFYVLKELHGSDRFPKVLKLNLRCKIPAIARCNLSKSDWALFRKEFSFIRMIALGQGLINTFFN